VADGDHYVPKYTPVHPAIIAAARILTGSDRAALFLIAAAAVFGAAWLAWEVSGSRRAARWAALILACSPVFLIQSATYLSYLSTLALLQFFAAALLRGGRLRSPRCLGLAGLMLGLAIFARPFDAVLVSAPFLTWWVWSRRSAWRGLLRDGRWLVAGAALPLAAMFAYFWAATGNPLRPPFTLLHESDTVGFGSRRMFEEQAPLVHTPLRGLYGSFRHLVYMSYWCFGGLLLVGLAVFAAIRGRGAARALAVVAVTVPAGYVFFWGIYGALKWGGPGRLGPFYVLPVITPLAILGAMSLLRLFHWDRTVGRLAVLGMAAVSAFVLVNTVIGNRPYTAERERLLAPVLERNLTSAVVFLPDLQGPWLLQPFVIARNAGFDGPVVWAIDRGRAANAAVLRSFPDRQAYQVVAVGVPGRKPPNLNYMTRLKPYPRPGA
jgi:4-amino-4-deoxy-L-arabinose transferase-like glycosyltransferase